MLMTERAGCTLCRAPGCKTHRCHMIVGSANASACKKTPVAGGAEFLLSL
jgi:hypothetical protein